MHELPIQAKILGSELWALYQTLLQVVPPVKSLSDNATVHKGICRGRDWFTAVCGKRLGGRRGGVGTLFTFSKVKSHQTEEAVDALRGDRTGGCQCKHRCGPAGEAGSGVVQR